MPTFEEHMKALREIQIAHNISEAEGILLIELITFVHHQGWSRPLAVKLLSAGATLIDVIKTDKKG